MCTLALRGRTSVHSRAGNATCSHKTHLWYIGVYFARVCDLTAGQNIHQFTWNTSVKNVHVHSNALLLPLYCFRCSVTCSSTVKNVYVHSNALLLPLYCYRCSITLFLHPLICVADVWCARLGLPKGGEKKTLHGWRILRDSQTFRLIAGQFRQM